jgi:hypothetical protein
MLFQSRLLVTDVSLAPQLLLRAIWQNIVICRIDRKATYKRHLANDNSGIVNLKSKFCISVSCVLLASLVGFSDIPLFSL